MLFNLQDRIINYLGGQVKTSKGSVLMKSQCMDWHMPASDNKHRPIVVSTVIMTELVPIYFNRRRIDIMTDFNPQCLHHVRAIINSCIQWYADSCYGWLGKSHFLSILPKKFHILFCKCVTYVLCNGICHILRNSELLSEIS